MQEGKQFEKREKEPRGKVLKFFELKKEEEDKLKERISEHDGTIRIFVHPEYEQYAKYAEESKKPGVSGNTKEEKMKTAKKLRKMNNALERILKLPPEEAPPIVILQAIEGVGSLFGFRSPYKTEIDALEKKGDYAEELVQKYKTCNDIYIVPTETYSSTPLLAYAQNAKEAWEELNDILKSLGVKKVIIGGAELYTPSESFIEIVEKRKESLDVIKHLRGCLGGAVINLKDGFEIELSTLTHPEGRKEIRKKQKKLSKNE